MCKYIITILKIVNVGDSYLACVGHASWDLVLTSYFSNLSPPPLLDSPQAIFETFRQLHHALKEDYFLNPREDEEDEFESSRLDCLIANSAGIFGLYSLRSVMEYTKFYAFGSGYRFALGAMWVLYGTGASAEEIARAGLEASAEFDGSTRAPIEVKTVSLGTLP